jgi:hypothetical protein
VSAEIEQRREEVRRNPEDLTARYNLAVAYQGARRFGPPAGNIGEYCTDARTVGTADTASGFVSITRAGTKRPLRSSDAP